MTVYAAAELTVSYMVINNKKPITKMILMISVMPVISTGSCAVTVKPRDVTNEK